jgi:hypothetical protein
MSRILYVACVAIVVTGVCFGQQRGILLEDLTWVEAEKVLKPETVVVIPIGAESAPNRKNMGRT